MRLKPENKGLVLESTVLYMAFEDSVDELPNCRTVKPSMMLLMRPLKLQLFPVENPIIAGTIVQVGKEA